jgi:membrane associated rhomboid family serine protease
MFIPVGSDRDPRRLPAATLLIILVTAVTYAAVTIGLRAGAPWAEAALVKGAFTATRTGFRWWQPFTYQFLHDPSSIAHVAFNMIFLWVFGRSVEGRIGSWWFAAFYLAGGAFAALGQWMVSSGPMIGASGAVAGATGAFAALFPRSTVRVLVVFFLIGIYEVPSLLFVGIYVAIDALNQGLNFLGRSKEPVAYAAHLAGYAWGLGVAILLLSTRLLPRTEMDLFAMWTQWRRRQAMRGAVRGTAGGPWASASADTSARVASSRVAGTARGAQPDAQAAAPEDPARAAARGKLNAAIAAADAASVRDAWHALAAIDVRTPLPERTLLDAGALLHAHGDLAAAADAWTRMIERFPRSTQAPAAALLASAVLARRLGQAERAARMLTDWLPRLRDGDHDEQARALAAELGVAWPAVG